MQVHAHRQSAMAMHVAMQAGSRCPLCPALLPAQAQDGHDCEADVDGHDYEAVPRGLVYLPLRGRASALLWGVPLTNVPGG